MRYTANRKNLEGKYTEAAELEKAYALASVRLKKLIETEKVKKTQEWRRISSGITDILTAVRLAERRAHFFPVTSVSPSERKEHEEESGNDD